MIGKYRLAICCAAACLPSWLSWNVRQRGSFPSASQPVHESSSSVLPRLLKSPTP